MRVLDDEDMKVMAEAHERIAKQVIQSIVNDMIVVGAGLEDILDLLESIVAGVMLYVHEVAKDAPIDALLSMLERRAYMRFIKATSTPSEANDNPSDQTS